MFCPFFFILPVFDLVFILQLPVLLYHGTKADRSVLRIKMKRRQPVTSALQCCPVVVTSYQIAMNDGKVMAHYDWKMIVVDEGHRIKNTHCRLIKYDS